jgi:hypothetical protein
VGILAEPDTVIPTATVPVAVVAVNVVEAEEALLTVEVAITALVLFARVNDTVVFANAVSEKL